MMRVLQWSILLLALLLAGCRESQRPTEAPQPTPPFTLQMRVEPEPPTVGQAVLLITLTEVSGAPINDAQISVRGDMNHAGMEPVFGESTAGANGLYRVPFQWTMGGDWIITVTARLADDSVIEQEFNLSVAS